MKKLFNLFLIGLTAVFLITGCKGTSSESDLIKVNISTDLSLGRAISNPIASEQYSDYPVALTISNGTEQVFGQNFESLSDMHSSAQILLKPNSYTFSLEIYDKTKTTVILQGEVGAEISLETANVVIPLNFTNQENVSGAFKYSFEWAELETDVYDIVFELKDSFGDIADYTIIKARKNGSEHEYTLNDVALEIDDNFTSETNYDNLLKKDVTQHQFKLYVNYLTDFSNFGEYTLNGYFVSYEEYNDNVTTYFETDTPVYIYPDVTTTGSKKAYGWNRLFNWSIAAEKMNVIESTFSTITLTPDDEDKYTLDDNSFEALTGFFQDSMRAYELEITDLPKATYYDFAGWDYYLGNPEEHNFAKADGRILYDSAKGACIFNTKNVHENVVLVPVFNYHNYTITFTSDIEGAESYELSANHFNGIKLKATPYIVGASGGYYYLDEILQIPEWYTIKGWLNNVDEYTLTDTFYPEEDTVFEAIYTENTEFPDLRFQIRQSNGSKETFFDSATQNISVLDVKFVESDYKVPQDENKYALNYSVIRDYYQNEEQNISIAFYSSDEKINPATIDKDEWEYTRGGAGSGIYYYFDPPEENRIKYIYVKGFSFKNVPNSDPYIGWDAVPTNRYPEKQLLTIRIYNAGSAGIDVNFEDFETPENKQIIWSRTNNIGTAGLDSTLNGHTFYLDDVSNIYVGLKDIESFIGENYTISVSDNGRKLTGTFTSTGFPVILSAGSHFFEIIVTENKTRTEVLTAEAQFKVYSNRNDFVTVAGTKITGNENWTPESYIFKPGREINIPSLIVCDHEVTRGEYKEIMNQGPMPTNPEDKYAPSTAALDESVINEDNVPVDLRRWHEALWYCNYLSIKEGLTPCYYYEMDGVEERDPDKWKAAWGSYSGGTNWWFEAKWDKSANGYRLPTDAEWEYLARAGENYTYSGSNDVNEVAVFNNKNSNDKYAVCEVKTKKPNAFGLYDMSGNVFEACWDQYIENSDITASTPATGLEGTSKVTIRGGSVCSYGSYSNENDVYECKVNSRKDADRFDISHVTKAGFRVVRNLYAFDSEIKKDENYHWYSSSSSGEIIGKEAHKWVGELLSDPTDSTPGAIKYTCSTCNESKTESITYTEANFVEIENVIITGSEKWSPYSSVFKTNRKLSMPTILMSDHEVTKHEYESLIGNDPSGAGTSGYAPNNPVNNVSWFEALVYCNRRTLKENEEKDESEKLTPAYYFMIDDEKVIDPDTWIATYGAAPNSNNTSGAVDWRNIQFDYTANGYRLPVEAEWEWAARAGESYKYSGSNNIEEVAWFKGNSNDAGTHEVKLLKPNKYGLYDMSGNVREWCWDGNSSSIDSNTPLTGTQDPSKLSSRVHRGGSWNQDASYCSVNNSSYDYDHLSFFGNIGFRVVRNKYQYELKSDGEMHWYEAVDTEDGDTFMNEKHRWEITEVIEPTSESNGQLTYTCPGCGKVKTESVKYVDPNAFVRVNGIEITGTETWTPTSSVFISGRAITLPTFEICNHEVTRQEYESVMGKDPSYAQPSGYTPYNPVNMVSWYDALVYCNKLTLRENEGKAESEKLTPAYYFMIGGEKVTDPDLWIEKLGKQNDENSLWHNVIFDYTANGYRLPVEAEWEYAARGGESYNYAGSNEITEIAWYKDNSGSVTYQVCSLNPNGYGLYDMSGNVSEWCWDNYPLSDNITAKTPVTGLEPSPDSNYWYHRQRGGSYVSYANYCTVNYRSSEFAHGKQLTQGFRIVRTISPVIDYESSVNTDTFNWYENPIDVSTGSAATSSSTDIYFGVFPKTVLPTDSAITIDETKTKEIGTNTYYKGSDNNWYAKADENSYGTSYKYSDGSTVNQKTESSSRYFKVEPIKWKVLTTNYNSSGKALLVAENVLIGNIPFYADSKTRTIDETTVYANNYKYSTIRAYLNGKYETEDTQGDEYTGKGFLQTAFTNTAQSYIENTQVDNSTKSACYDDTTLKINSCDNTLDKIFLLSTSEVVNGDYGFDAYAATSDASKNTSRQRVSTDYAKANNVIESSNGGTWWLRSPFGTASTASTDAVRTVTYQGAANGNGPANTMYYGIVPALTISLQ